MTKKLSQEFSRTENQILGALSRLDEFILNPLIEGHSGSTPETSRNILRTNQGTNENDSQNDLHPEAGISQSQTRINSGPVDADYKYRLVFSQRPENFSIERKIL